MLLSVRGHAGIRAIVTLVASAAAIGACTRQDSPSEPARRPGSVLLTPQPSSQQVADTGDLDRIRARGVLRILVPPRTEEVLRRPDSLVRLERDLAAHFAERYEIDAQLVEVDDYGSLIPELLIGHGDIIAGQMTITESRLKQVEFTRPVDTVSEIVIGAKEAEDLPRTPAELAGRTVHVPEDSAYIESLHALQSGDAQGLTIIEVPGETDVEELAYDVSQGTKALTVVDSNRLKVIQAYNRKLERLFALETGRELAWAVRPGNSKLKAAADAFLIEAAMTTHSRERSLGDMEELRARGSLRLITRNNAVNYYLHRGQHLGFDYELSKLLADSLGLRLEVVVPPSRDQLIPWLLKGKGDIIAASLTVTEERAKEVRFSKPYLFVDEMLVQRTSGDRRLKGPEDLADAIIHVRESSSYHDTLLALQERYGFSISFADEEVETETLVAQVAAGIIDFTVADTHILGVERLVHDNVEAAFTLHGLLSAPDENGDAVAASAGESVAGSATASGSTPATASATASAPAAGTTSRPGDRGAKHIAFAMRPTSTKLASLTDDFVRRQFRGLQFNMLRSRYFGNQRRAIEAKEERAGETGVLSPYDDLIKKYSERYELDWRLMASLAYQESRFDPSARSWVGALGLFQVMPATGKELGFDNLVDPEQSTHAGIKYIYRLIERFEPTLAFRQRVRFALASYNAGYGHVQDARRLAGELGMNPDRWFKNVEQAMLLLQQPKYYRRARFGYVRGKEPVQYVSRIQLRYDNYVKLLPR